MDGNHVFEIQEAQTGIVPRHEEANQRGHHLAGVIAQGLQALQGVHTAHNPIRHIVAEHCNGNPAFKNDFGCFRINKGIEFHARTAQDKLRGTAHHTNSLDFRNQIRESLNQ